MHAYHVRTNCRATVTERWTITSPTPLSRSHITDILEDGDDDRPEGMTIDCTEEEVSDEEDREVLDIDVDEGELAPDEPDDDDGCPFDDPDCTSRADECHDACKRTPPIPDGNGGVR